MGTPTQRLLTLLPPNHVTLTYLFISNHRSYCYQIWSVKSTPWQGSIGHFSIGCSKYFVIINLQERHALVVVDLLADSCVCTWNKSNIHRVFLWKYLVAGSHYLFLQRGSLLDIWLGSKYASCSLDASCEMVPLSSYTLQYLS